MGKLFKILAVNTLIAALYALLAGSLIGWPAVPRSFGVTLIYANVIGTAAHFLLRPVGERLAGLVDDFECGASMFGKARRIRRLLRRAGFAGGEAIFIGYRREDTADVAGRVYDAMAARFGKARVFKDVNTIGPGVDFGAYIRGMLPQCRVALMLIGPYLPGVKRAGWMAVVLPILALLFPWHAALFGMRVAFLHLAVGVAFSLLTPFALCVVTWWPLRASASRTASGMRSETASWLAIGCGHSAPRNAELTT